ncbi:MAG: DM13 domain-containing protein [Pseudomonadales bacterium]
MKNIIISLSLLLLAALTAGTAIAADQNTELASGSLQAAFSSWGKPSITGNWKILQEGGRHYIELADNFKAKKGPDVKIFLSPTPAAEITGANAVKGSVFVTLVADFEGRTRIEIPAGADVNQFQSLVFHCEAYTKLWGSSALR